MLQKVGHLLKNHQKLVDLLEIKQLFLQSTVHKGFDPIFRKMFQKVGQLLKNHQNLSISSR